MGELDVARRHLDNLAAEPRPAGSAAEARARAYAATELRASGFSVAEEPFEYSALPGRYATPLSGVASVGTLALAGLLGCRGQWLGALLLLVLGATVLGALASWAARRGVLDAPLFRERGVNLVARRGVPAVWLVAHLDSKSQPVPIGLRAAGIAATAAVWLVAAGVALAQGFDAPVASWWPWVAAAGIVAGLPIAASVVGARSPGALDNASGVASVLLAAAALAPNHPTAVLLTGAEELGLAGARAWARTAPPGVAINCDGVDDSGTVTCMYTRTRPDRLLAAAARAAASAGLELRARKLVPGILVDAVALADAGWETVTVSRGTVRTLARIHTPRDARDALDGVGVVQAARIIRLVAEEVH